MKMHRPTYFARKGRASNLPTRMTCVRNLVAHTKLKVRQPGQGGITGEVQTDQLSSVKLANSTNTDDLSHHSDSQSRSERMREQLLAREKEELNKIEGSNSSAEAVNNNKRAANKPVAGLIMNVPSAASENYDDRDIIDDNEEDDEKKNAGTGGDDGFDSSEYEESDEDDSDDEAALMAEVSICANNKLIISTCVYSL